MDTLLMIGIGVLVVLFVLGIFTVFNIARYLQRIIVILEGIQISVDEWFSEIANGINSTPQEKSAIDRQYEQMIELSKKGE